MKSHCIYRSTFQNLRLRLPRKRAELVQEEGLETKELARYGRVREDLGATLKIFLLGEWMRMMGEARVCQGVPIDNKFY
jgi:hypothetical protein